MKKVLFIGNYYPYSLEKAIIQNSKGNGLSFSSNHFNHKLLSGFDKKQYVVTVISAPIFGVYPKFTSIKKFPFCEIESENNVYYCPYNNNSIFRIISRTRSISKQIKAILKKETFDIVIVSELHIPFLKTIKYAKKYSNCTATIIVLDLPEFSYLGSKKRPLYKLAKYFNNKIIYRLTSKTDSFVFLSKYMNEGIINKTNKPFIVSETLIQEKEYKYINSGKPIVTYAGTLHYSFGMRLLIDAFKKSNDAFMLIVAGSGDAENEIKKLASINNNIVFYGMLENSQLKDIFDKTSVFVNPRKGTESFSRVSFPSKIGEYLSCCKPVVTFDLPSFDNEIKKVLFIPKEETADSLLDSLLEAINLSPSERQKIKIKTAEYISRFKPENVVNEMEKKLWKVEKKS